LKLPVLNLLQRKALQWNIKENNDIINKTDQGIVRDACLIAAERLNIMKLHLMGLCTLCKNNRGELKRPAYLP
jgi:hypothetical protein